jgi:hypothetical protein
MSRWDIDEYRHECKPVIYTREPFSFLSDSNGACHDPISYQEPAKKEEKTYRTVLAGAKPGGVVHYYIVNPVIKRVMFNDPATIVFWTDGTKTVVHRGDEAFDPEKAIAMATLKKIGGNKGRYYNQIKKWAATYESPEELDVDSFSKLLARCFTGIIDFGCKK